MPMKRYKSAARCLCPTRREPRANMRDLNLLSQFSKQCLSKRHICDMQFADVACALKTQTAINSAMPERLRTLRHCIFTGRVVKINKMTRPPAGSRGSCRTLMEAWTGIKGRSHSLAGKRIAAYLPRTAAKPASRSARISSMCSVPMDRRMVFW